MKITQIPTPLLGGPSNGGSVSLKPALGTGPKGDTGNTGGPGPQGPPGPGTGAGAWQPSTAYTANQVVQAPDGSMISRNASGTSRASFDATEQDAWTAVVGKAGTVAASALSDSIAQQAAPVTGSSEYAAVGTVQPRETSVVFAGPELASVVGGSAMTNTGSPAYISYWPMTKAGGLQLLGRAGIEPPTWATRVDKVRVRWLCTTGAGTGVPKLRAQVGMYRVDAGGDPTAPALPTSGDLTPALVSTANRVTTTEFGPGPSGWNIVPNQKVNVLVGRNGASSGDTASSTTIGITAIEVVWA